MTNPVAVLVEDDAQQAEFSSGIVEAAGFQTSVFNSIAEVRSFLRDSSVAIDLFVLDRRLPVNFGETATDEFGDELLEEVRTSFPDACIVVFTGFATIRHVQESVRGSGQLPELAGLALDRITVLEKDQSLEFRGHLRSYRHLIQELDNIEVMLPDGVMLNDRVRRVLRRLAFDYKAVSIDVTPLGGGLSGAGVWRCDLMREEGQVATVIAKQVKKQVPPGGLSDLLPRVNSTATVRTLSGMMSGAYLNVLQVAGRSTFSVMEILRSRPDDAVSLLRPLWDALGEIAEQRRVLTIAELCESLISWEELTELLSRQGVAVPAGTLTASARIGARHGDLHPCNVLIDGTNAVLIDFDSAVFASGSLDPVTMLISTLVHPDSPIRGVAWPSVDEIVESFGSADFGRGSAVEGWFAGLFVWTEQRRTSVREFWSLVLAYSGRQLRYGDVLSDEEVLMRVLALVRRASDELCNS
ncbi:phosphotransferase [Rathayibacter sp. SD072]|uniref:phosphotransferase n=1 Tax=Rathayibacter sp. SD072 TaxID=2781731 RepID=UPI001A95BD46|nr:phosphotransferase [Rathayibacter sp. SD072]MBO0985272.1 phosphotransferase [Rathayibacter sp. SD072]